MCHDTLYLLTLPNENRYKIAIESSRRENGIMGEGVDFLLENRNALYKSFLPTDTTPLFEYVLVLMFN